MVRGEARILLPVLLLCLILVPALCLASAWAIRKGSFLAKASFFYQASSEEFILNPRYAGGQLRPSGSKLPYPSGGRAVSRAYQLELRRGISERVEGVVKFSYYDLRYDDDRTSRHNRGPGDILAEMIFQVVRNPLASSLRLAVKIPTAEFTVDPDKLPLGENQWDVESALALGRSLYPLPAYAAGEIGYRLRLENPRTKVKPGDELFFYLEAGADPLPHVFLKILFEGFSSRPRENRESGFIVKDDKGRKALSLTPYLAVYPNRKLFVEVGWKMMLAGREYPAGPQLLFSLGIDTTRQ